MNKPAVVYWTLAISVGAAVGIGGYTFDFSRQGQLTLARRSATQVSASR